MFGEKCLAYLLASARESGIAYLEDPRICLREWFSGEEESDIWDVVVSDFPENFADEPYLLVSLAGVFK